MLALPLGPDLAGSPPRILLADADRDNRALYHTFLESAAHWSISEASSGPEALAVFEDAATVPEAVVFDVLLPKLDGYDLCRRIRSVPAGRETTLIALTGYPLREVDRERLADLGVALVLTKPYSPQGLLTDLRTQLVRARDARARAEEVRRRARAAQSRAGELQARSRQLLSYFNTLCRDEGCRTVYQRIRREYHDWPGLALTEAQIRRLWDIPPGRCAELLEDLVRDGVLRRTGRGTYRRVGG